MLGYLILPPWIYRNIPLLIFVSIESTFWICPAHGHVEGHDQLIHRLQAVRM